MRRLIFTLLYDSGSFMLSRNFRLQKVGNIDWLFTNYDFANVSRGLDELMVLDVSRGVRNTADFADKVKHIASLCFIPMTVGGGITSFDIAQSYIRSGADKLLINSSFSKDPSLCRKLANHFGRQCIVSGIDYKLDSQNQRMVMICNGSEEVAVDLSKYVDFVQENGAGEILFQSMDQDGTGMGFDLSVVDDLRLPPEVPCILMGGVGKSGHIISGLQHKSVDAVATANLFNFIGSAFLEVRQSISVAGIDIACWDNRDFISLRGKFSSKM